MIKRILALAWLAACGGSGGSKDASPGATCTPSCVDSTVCRFGTCVAPPSPCTMASDCAGDTYCNPTLGECLPWGVGTTDLYDPACVREPTPGVFFPAAQCEWLGPPAGDAFPDHRNVLSTPMVATFNRTDEFARPSIVFVSYNGTDGGAMACEGTNPLLFGVIRVIDGATCTQQATLAMPPVVGATSVAIADVGGDDDTPEIIAARASGGLVAYTYAAGAWAILWETSSQFADTFCNYTGPSVHDLDDDGRPEIIHLGAVYDADGVALDESLTGQHGSYPGYIPVIADVDVDGIPELVTGGALYSWNAATDKWMPKTDALGTAGQIAVGDFGTFGADPNADQRAVRDGIAEVVVVAGGVARVMTIAGRVIFNANLPAGSPGDVVGQGGAPTIADFDGDGLPEIATAGATAFAVLDMDCGASPVAATCPSLATNGIAWFQPSQDRSSNMTGSSVFDFDGDGRAEAVYGDECFTRVYDGVTGDVQYSRYRTSCTWYEMPVIADVDADFNAEIVSTSNTNCAVSCPTEDPIFDGVRCLDTSDCAGQSQCVRNAPADALGFCRCVEDSDCGGDGFICRDPLSGPSTAGRVCRAGHPGAGSAFGVRVLSDLLDRWISTRPIWNQHAYSVTHITDDGAVPRTSQTVPNWTTDGLNNFRQNSRGDGIAAGASPDLTVRSVLPMCNGVDASLSVEVCNRGTEPVARGLLGAVYSGTHVLVATFATTRNLLPGVCESVIVSVGSEQGELIVVVDDGGDGVSTTLECREENNRATIDVVCP